MDHHSLPNGQVALLGRLAIPGNVHGVGDKFYLDALAIRCFDCDGIGAHLFERADNVLFIAVS